MSKTITIPKNNNPFIVNINNREYIYKGGETVEVPDEVAEVIEAHTEAQPMAQPQHTEVPQASGFAYSSAERKFELIGTIDFSTEEMAKAASYVEYDVHEVSEILAVWTDMVNTSATNSHVVLSVNGDYTFSINFGKTSKSGGVLSGYTRLKVYEGIGTTLEMSAGAIAPTNYSHMSGAEETSYNMLPLITKINKMRVGNPGTQYYAVGGILKIYAR